MITFKQKEFSEFDAMRSLYLELTRNSGNPNKFQMIKLNSLLPILKGNNVVIERFVITTGPFKRDTYRMYLKVGARAKMPDEVRLPGKVYDATLLNATLNIGNGGGGNNNNNNNNNQNQQGGQRDGNGNDNRQKNFSTTPTFKQKEFGKGHGGGGGGNSLNFPVNIKYEVTELLGEAVNYDKKSRSLVLEFKNLQDAVRAINILPFGINYKIYLLDIDS